MCREKFVDILLMIIICPHTLKEPSQPRSRLLRNVVAQQILLQVVTVICTLFFDR